MNIVHLVVVENSFYILESGRTVQNSAHFSLILGTKNLVKIGTQRGLHNSLCRSVRMSVGPQKMFQKISLPLHALFDR